MRSTASLSALPRGGAGTLVAAVAFFVPGCAPESDARGETAVEDEAHIRGHVAGMSAHHLCAGVFVVGRDYERSVEEVVAQDIRPFDRFDWQDDFEYAVDFETRTASVSGDGVPTQYAEYNGDQGCTLLPAGFEDVTFEPVVV